MAVTGQTAIDVDVSAKLSAALAPFIAIVAGLSLLLLMVVFRSLLVRKAWYLRRWLDRVLPDLDVEGASRREPRPTAPPAPAELAGSGAGTTDRSVERSLWAYRAPAGTGVAVRAVRKRAKGRYGT